MINNYERLIAASRAAAVHLLSSFFVAFLASILVFYFWYPFPYRELSGGRQLFLLIVFVDVVCGPLLTLVLFSPSKSRVELCCDLGFIVLIQLCSLSYGLYTVWEARPLFLVLDKDRFTVVVTSDIDKGSLGALQPSLKPGFFSKPVLVGLRNPVNLDEKNKVLLASISGGKDYAERPEFYLPYEGSDALRSLMAAKPLAAFLKRQPDQQLAAEKLAAEKKADLAQWVYLPVRGRQDWIAMLNNQGEIQGFLKGDGF